MTKIATKAQHRAKNKGSQYLISPQKKAAKIGVRTSFSAVPLGMNGYPAQIFSFDC